ncbi:unnamed protein product [Rotaria sp. Silwood2]|nr:unnamed protein product [Rotaria sp. Silwood2]CAF2747322.1 unnamed protein product [Rotaria sp. Silwood2]CAF2874113.1 unnamed protein product [Rotaria sp. Silwood2]CAF3932998.1 unnamed protein product [Rotaria sp. Silwood2]CAF3945479.1 unnamed protein product [Rotaria sp. Silwood2]
MSNPLHRFMPVPTNENCLSVPTLAHRPSSRISMQTNNYDEDGGLNSLSSHYKSLRHFYHPFQSHIYNFLERPCGIYCFLYHFTVFSIVIGCLVYSSILTVYAERSYSVLFWMEFVLFILFLLEYIVRVWSSGCRNKYRGRHGRLLFMRKLMSIIDLCVIIGYAILLWMNLNTTQFNVQFIRYIRILQILRFLHVDRRLTSWRLLGSVMYDHRYELVATLYFCFIFLIVVAYLIWLVEKDVSKSPNEDMFHSFADTLWWAIVTMTTIGYGDKYPRTYIGKIITSCLCICGVAFWTLPSGIIGSGFALKVEQKKREKQFNRLIPAAANLIQNWWRFVASRHPNTKATWRIYRIEIKRTNKFGRHTGSAFTIPTPNNINRTHSTPRMRHGLNALNTSSSGIPLDKISWRKVDGIEDLDNNQLIVIRMIRIIKYHVARRKFSEAHKPYDFKDIMDENARGNIKVMYALSDIQRRLDQTLGLPKSNSNIVSDKDREQFTLNAKVQRLEIKIGELEKKTNRVISLLEELCHRSHSEGTNVTMNRISAVAENLCHRSHSEETNVIMNRIPAVAEELTSGK